MASKASGARAPEGPPVPILSVIVPTANRPDALIRLLRDLARQTLPADRFEVVVCDDGSDPPAADTLARVETPWPFHLAVERQARRGPAAARNRAIARARGRFLVILNDDAGPPPDLLARHLAAQESSPSPRAWLGRFDFAPDCVTPFTSAAVELGLLFPYHEMKRDEPSAGRFFWTCNLSVPRESLLAAGGFDESFARPVCEDVELGYRLEQRGVRVFFLDGAPCLHHHRVTAAWLAQRQVELGRNVVALWRKHRDPELFPWIRSANGDERALASALERDVKARGSGFVELAREIDASIAGGAAADAATLKTKVARVNEDALRLGLLLGLKPSLAQDFSSATAPSPADRIGQELPVAREEGAHAPGSGGRRMRILFSNAPWWDSVKPDGSVVGVRAGSRWPHTIGSRSTPTNYVFGSYLPYPFFMGYAASYARKHVRNAEVVLRDSLATRESYESYLQYIRDNAFDYVVIETATASWDHDAQIVRLIKLLQPQTKIVLTGTIAGTDVGRLIDEHGIHACVKGEYEKNCVKVFEGASGVLDHDLLTQEEMNAAPFPDWNDETWWRYCDWNPRGQEMPHAQVWSSRGCPFKCIFCVWPASMTGNDPDGTGVRTVRHYTPEYMEAYLRWLTTTYRFKCIYFDDDTFNLGNPHVLRMCDVMTKIGMKWSAMCRPDTIKRETWKAMKEAGCFGVKLGFESGNQYVVDQIVNKHLDLAEAADVVRYVKSLGMTVHGTFTSGLPGETKEQMAETMRFIHSLPFDTYQHSGTAEIEGTPLHTLRERGSLAKYAGARIDASYNRHTDGNKKFQQMAKELAESVA